MKRASLNHTFRLVWSDRQGAFVAVAEMARARGKRSTLVAACMLSALAGVSGSAQALDPGALPTGAQIVAGQGSVAQQGANMVVQQNTAAMIANWQSFNIGQNASVRFVQPSASAIALNRVLGSDPSQLFGQLSANGRVVLVNPNGVLFGASSRVDAAALVASSLDIRDEDFLAGKYRFDAGLQAAGVSNLGELSARDGGFVALVGATVDNQGRVVASNGQVALAAGSSVELAITDSGLVGVQVDAASAGARIDNSGFVAADGGRVWMTARQAAPMLATAINQTGVVRADTLAQRNGEIWLDGGANGIVELAGNTQARGMVAGDAGGKVVATGGRVEVSGAVDASGKAGGGSIYIGGGWQGKDPAIAEARQVGILDGATLSADATEAGDGGTIVAWSGEFTQVNGALSARGAGVGARGGQVETSSRGSLGVLGSVDVSSPDGHGGEWLLDPENINVVAASGAPLAGAGVNPVTYTATTAPGTAEVLASAIESTLNAGGNVTLLASNDINVLADIAKTNGATVGLLNPYQEFSTLIFQAGNNINVGTSGQSVKISATNNVASSTITRSLNVEFQGSGGAVATDTGTISIYGEISTNGGSVNFYKPTLLASTKPVSTQVETANTAGSPANTTPDSGNVTFHKVVTLGGTGSVTIDTQSALDGSQNYLRRGGNVVFHEQIVSQDGDSPRDLIVNTTGAISNSFLGGNANYSGSVTFNGRVGTVANPLRSLTLTGPSSVFLNTDQINLRRQAGSTMDLTAPGSYVTRLVLGQANTTIAVRGFEAGSADYLQTTFDIIAGDLLAGAATLNIESDRSIQVLGTQADPRLITGAQAGGGQVALTVNLKPSQKAAANSGSVFLQDAVVRSHGGAINLGSSAQRAYGVASEQNTDGIRIQASTLDSAGGDISLYGNAATSSTTGGAAVDIFGASTLSAGAGSILIDGRVSSTSGGANKDAVLIGNRGQATVAIETTSGAISIVGDASAMPTATVGASYNGVEISDAAMIRSVSGDIEITGKGGGGNNSNVGENYGIKLRDTDTQIVSQTGDITLTGVTGGKTSSHGLFAAGNGIAIGQERATDTAKTVVSARPFTGNVNLIADTMSFVNNSSSRLRITSARSGVDASTGQLNIRSYTDTGIQIGGTEPSPPSVPGNPLFLKSDWFAGSNAVFQAGFGEINIGGYGSAAIGSTSVPAESTGTLTVAGATTVRDSLNLLMTGVGGQVVVDAPLTVQGSGSANRVLDIEANGGITATAQNSLISVDKLRLAGSGDFILSGPNLVNTLAVDNAAGKVQFNNAVDLVVGTVGGTRRGAAFESVGVLAGAGDVTLSAANGTLTQRDDISADGHVVALKAAAGAVMQQATDTAGSGVPVITADALAVTARDTSVLDNANAVDTLAVKMTGAVTQQLTFRSATGITVASVTDGTGVTVNGAELPGILSLRADAGGITQTHRIQAGAVAARATGDVDLSLRNGSGGAVNLIEKLAANSSTGEVKVLNNTTLQVATVDSLAGVSTELDGRDIAIATASGDLVLSAGLGVGQSGTADGTVRLEATQGAIFQGDTPIVADALLLRARNSSAVDADNQVNVLAAEITGAAQGLNFVAAGPLVLGEVAGVNGLGDAALIAGAAGVVVPGTAAIKVNTGDLTQTEAVVAGGLSVHALTGSVVLDGSGNDIGKLSARLEGEGESLTVRSRAGLAVDTVNGVAGIVTQNGAVNLTASGDVDSTSGDLSMVQAINAGTATVELVSGQGAVTQSGSGRVLAAALGVEARKASSLAGANEVATLAAEVQDAGEQFVFVNAKGLTVGTVGARSGVITEGGNIALRTTSTDAAEHLLLEQAVSTGSTAAGIVNLQSVGGMVSASAVAGTVTGASLAVRAVGGVDLARANDVGTLAAVATAGDVVFNDINGLAIGTVGDLSGLSAIGNTLDLRAGGPMTQTAGNLTAARLAVEAAGNVSLLSTGNRVATVAAEVSGGDFRYRDAGAVTIGTVARSAAASLSGIDADGAIWMRTGTDITLAAPVEARASGDQALVLAATRTFTNRAGSVALSAPNGRWLVYDDNPLLVDRFDGLQYAFRRLRTLYDNYPPAGVAERGNGYITTAVLLDPDQAVRQPGGSTVSGGEPLNTTTSIAIPGERSAMSGSGLADTLRWADTPVGELPSGPVALVGFDRGGLTSGMLPQLPLQVALAAQERFNIPLLDLIPGGVVLGASLADGSTLPNWLGVDQARGVLIGELPAGQEQLPLVRVVVRAADGREGEILLQLVPRKPGREVVLVQ